MLRITQICRSFATRLITRRIYIMRFVLMAFPCFIFLTVGTKFMHFELHKTCSVSPICNEIISDKYQELELSSFTSFPRATVVNIDIPTNISHVVEPLYPIMLWNKYLINNRDLCNLDANISIIVLVKTNPLNFNRRHIIRNTWGNYRYFQHLGTIRVLFLMGKVHNMEHQLKVSREFQKYLDILQGDFLDTYRNLTNKGIMGLRWISENCIQAKMILNVDDDIILDMYHLLRNMYPKFKTKTRYVICNIFKDAPIVRDRTQKWYVRDSELKGIGLLDKILYPPYCAGFTVFLAADLIPIMLEIARATPFFWIDDVYLYGLLPLKVGSIEYYNLSSNYTFSFEEAMTCFCSSSTCNMLSIAEMKTENMCTIWNIIQSYYMKRETLKVA